MLKAYAAYLQQGHLEAVVQELADLLTEPTSRVSRHFAPLPREEQLAHLRASVLELLNGLAEGNATEHARRRQEAWLAGDMRGLTLEAFGSEDIVVLFALQRRVLQKFLPGFVSTAAEAIALCQALDAYFDERARLSAQVLDQLRQQVEAREHVMRRLLTDAQTLAKLGSWEWDLNTGEITWSDEMYQIYGVPLGSPPLSYEAQLQRMPPEDRAVLESRVKLRVNTGVRTSHVEFHLNRPDGSQRLIRGHSVLDHDEAGKPTRFYGTVQDITEQRRAESALAVSEHRFRAIFDHAANSISLLSLDGHFLDVNPGFSQLFGYTREEALGQTSALISGPEDQAAALQACREVCRGLRESFRMEKRYRRKDGSEVWGYLTLSLIRDHAGEPSHTVAMVVDITALKQVQAQLIDKARELVSQKNLVESLIEHIPAAVTYLDRELYFRWNNAAHCRTVGLPREQIVGRHVTEVFGDVTSERLAQFARALNDRELVTLKGVPRHLPRDEESADPVTYWDISLVPIADEDAPPHGVLLVAVDATDRVKVQRLQQGQIDQLQEVDRMKNQFLGILSHELRTPLNAIMAFSSILDDEVPGQLNDLQHGYLRQVLANSEVLLTLINDLLDMSRLQAGKFALTPAPMRFEHTLEEVLASLAALASDKRQDLQTELAGPLPPLVADEQRVGQVLTNLLSNAIKFTPAGGRIRVGAELADGRLRCWVSDTGIGIAREDFTKLFMPFTQLDSTNTRSAGGTGLGLSICQALVEAHGGQIGVESQPGLGSTFWFTLPLSPEASPLASAES